MPSNTFITPDTITTITFLSDRPIEGISQYGPYRAYRVRIEDGSEHLFYPPKYLFDDIAAVAGTGTVVRLRATRAQTRDGHAYNRIELLEADVVGRAPQDAPAARPTPPRADDNADRILASVALKCATQTRGIAGEPDEVLATAARYLGWLQRPTIRAAS